MARNNGPRDEKLIQELYEKLNWFTFQASDEEFDAEQVRAILNLLDSLDPLPDVKAMPEGENAAEDNSAPAKESESLSGTVSAADPAAAFERFKKKYNITEEELAGKNGRNTDSNGSAAEGKIISFRPGNGDSAELSKELAFDGPQVQEKLAQAKAVSGETGVDALGVDASGEASAVAASGGNTAGAKKFAKRWKRFISSAWGKAAVAVIIALAAGTGWTIRTSAVQQKPFLEVLENGVNRLRIIVTGNEMEEVVYHSNEERYESWGDIHEKNIDMLVPEYIPEEMVLERLYGQDAGNYIFFVGIYYDMDQNSKLIISIKSFKENYADMDLAFENGWKQIKKDENIIYYQMKEIYKAFWKEGKYTYDIECEDLDELERIVKHMEK